MLATILMGKCHYNIISNERNHSTRVAGFIFDVQAPGKCLKEPYNTVSNTIIL
jgi:hypothetical protein